MEDPVVLKLQHGAMLSPEDKRALSDSYSKVHTVEARIDLISQGDTPEDVHVVLEGFACRYKLLPDGSRQIMAWLVPGDFCDLHVAVLGRMDHSIATLSTSKVARIPKDRVAELVKTSEQLSRALWWATLVDEAILREWLANMGRRPAHEQVAHLFCELLVRLKAVGLAQDDAMELPLTQVELADTVGLSSVHVNRVVQELRDEGLISWRGKVLKVLDVQRLKRFAGFEAGYLHLDGAA
ncbi:Crp/Fnr family transcriptional regulator [Phenylobacterium sp.]|uniref:Crp/Fnr family transcriptional regulator n=1 Tax=Phenylobacterium sp. TaxID=1871053 RepID=UPI002F95C667